MLNWHQKLLLFYVSTFIQQFSKRFFVLKSLLRKLLLWIRSFHFFKILFFLDVSICLKSFIFWWIQKIASKFRFVNCFFWKLWFRGNMVGLWVFILINSWSIKQKRLFFRMNFLHLFSLLFFYCHERLRKERVLRKVFFYENLFSFFACYFRWYKILFFFEWNSFGADSNLLTMNSYVFDSISEF